MENEAIVRTVPWVDEVVTWMYERAKRLKKIKSNSGFRELKEVKCEVNFGGIWALTHGVSCQNHALFNGNAIFAPAARRDEQL
jgi:hypothetical protein